MANVFTAPKSGNLTHVDFWTTSNNALYELYVWNGSFGSELAFQNGTCQEFGYYSIPLNEPASIDAGQQFTVAVNMTTPGYDYPIPVEYKDTFWLGVDPPIQPNVSFVRYTDSDPWVDLADYGENACLRARMKVIVPPEITSYAPESPVNDYECAKRSFNITINQTVNVSWQINGTEVQTNASETKATYTNTSAVNGTWNVSAVVSNANGTDMQTWVWTVTSPCFIATAAYGTSLHGDIDVLRDFRDEYLIPNPAGRAFVKIYYDTSPPLANAIRDNEGLRTAVREGVVKPVVHIARIVMG